MAAEPPPEPATEPLWGAETAKAIENFPISGEPVPATVIHWLGRIKAAAAIVNAELGLLDDDRARRIAAAAAAVAAGDHDAHFPVDVFQTGSGTSTNMNANEVIATLAGPDVHPNDHVNLGQSSNDVVPSAVHLAAVERCEQALVPALAGLRDALDAQARATSELPKAGRTHLMDAVPVTLGQEFAGYATQVRLGIERVTATLERVGRIPLGGTAVGTGLGTHPHFADRVRQRLAADLDTPIAAPVDAFEAQGARDGLVELSGALKVVAVSLTKIATDLAWMGSGPRCGLGEITLPELQKGSSIMPGKVNPVIPEVVCQVAAQVIGNDVAITVGATQGTFELAARVPLLARNLLSSIELLASASTVFATRCVAGIEPVTDGLRAHAEATLAAATALNPFVGYDRSAALVRRAERTGRSLRAVAVDAGTDPAVVDAALDPLRLARGGFIEPPDPPT